MQKNDFIIHPDVRSALRDGLPVLALESSILAQGMPYPESLDFAIKANEKVLQAGAQPATIAIINGNIKIGLNKDELVFMCSKSKEFQKVSYREIGYTMAVGACGATTVSAATHIARRAGIDVFATGGIGGVHRNFSEDLDLSQDLMALSRCPMVVVSAGAKSVLDLPKTMEMLEALGVLVVGYKTNEFPSFYSRESGINLDTSVNSVDEIVNIYKSSVGAGVESALLIANPIEKKHEIPMERVENYLTRALVSAKQNNIIGKALTPFLLKKLVELSEGECLLANISLAQNNIALGAQIATVLSTININN